MAHLRYRWVKKIGWTRGSRTGGCAKRHQRPCRRPLRPLRGLLWPCGRHLRPVHASSMVGSTADDHLTVDGGAMFVVGADPSMLLGPSRAPQTIRLLTAALSTPSRAPQTISDGLRRSGGSQQRAMVSRRDKHCLCASGAEVAEPRAVPSAPRSSRPAPRLAGARAIETDLGAISRPSALAGRRLAAATAGWRKASELFKHSCPIYSHTNGAEPRAVLELDHQFHVAYAC